MYVLKSMTGKTVVITGATSGIGLSSLIALAQEGAFVIGVGRNKQRCLEAENMLRSACPDARSLYLIADLSLQSQVRRLATEVDLELKKQGINALDVLVNNAGGYFGQYEQTEEGIERTLAVNHLAPFILTHELLPLLKNAPLARVIAVSSASHYNTWLDINRLNKPLIYVGICAYKVSKLANVLFTYELNRRLSQTSVRAFAVDPGLVNTEIGTKGTRGLSYLIWKTQQRKGVPPELPAKTVLFLSSEKSIQNVSDYYWCDCQPKIPSRLAQREDVAMRLWEKSERLCGIKS